jgi:Kef-type K+ transport system membrane component KefB
VALAERLGLAVILGAFLAGAVLSLVDRDRMMTHPAFRAKLEAVGFGVFIPVFFVASGLQFDLGALFGSVSAMIRVPLLLAALLLVRGLPAFVYRSLLERQQIAVAALLQATSLPFIVAATAIGLELGLVDAAESAALIGAGLLSVLTFPLLGLTLLRRGKPAGTAREPEPQPAPMAV